jgi:hypothetical protein
LFVIPDADAIFSGLPSPPICLSNVAGDARDVVVHRCDAEAAVHQLGFSFERPSPSRRRALARGNPAAERKQLWEPLQFDGPRLMTWTDSRAWHWNLVPFLAFPLIISDELIMSDRQLFQQVVSHFAVGSSMGPIFAAALVALSARDLFDAVLNSSAPITTLVILVFGISSYFGFGAAITGFIFIVMDEGPRKLS